MINTNLVVQIQMRIKQHLVIKKTQTTKAMLCTQSNLMICRSDKNVILGVGHKFTNTT